MTSRGLPPIFEFDHLALLLGRTNEYLASAVNRPSYHYRTFSIPKRLGGERLISSPYPALLECQQWINKNILYKLKTHKAAHGFVRQKSIVSNAKKHLNKKCLLKMDLLNFFPSINLRRVIAIFRSVGYPPNISFYIASLCCLEDSLPQGAATSPALSNLVAFKLDLRLNALSKQFKLVYTRYADDLTFSGRHIGLGFLSLVSSIIDDEGFSANHSKTKLIRGEGKKIVTGISVKDKTLKLPRAYKRKLRQEVHYIHKHGYIEHLRNRKIQDLKYIERLYGKVQFWLSIEPNNTFAQFSKSVLENIRDAS